MRGRGDTVSVVTGGNRGVGFGIVRGLCKQVGGTVILASRNETRGQAAVEELKKEGLNPVLELLDISSTDSINNFAEVVREKYGGIDILCNNAATAANNRNAPLLDRVKETMNTNFFGMINVTNTLLPLIRDGGRICQISSHIGMLDIVFEDASPVRRRLEDPALTEIDVMTIFTEYIDAVTNNNYSSFQFRMHPSHPYKCYPYQVMKCLQIAHTRALARRMATDHPLNIIINSCSPGHVATGLNSDGTLTVDEGAVTPLMLCQLPAGAPSGVFFYNSKPYNWSRKIDTTVMIENVKKRGYVALPA